MIHRSSSIFKLDPFLDTDGVLRVGGRLKRSMVDINEVHSGILPKANLITEAIVTWYHENVAHSGRSMTLNNLRKNDIWVISANPVVRRIIVRYVKCRKLRGAFGYKKRQIYQKVDALKHHYLLNVEWICLNLLLSEKEDQI